MKKLLAMVAIVGFATTAYGASIEMGFGPDTVGTIVGNEVTMGPTDHAYIDVWLRLGTGDNGFDSFFLGLDTNPALVEDFTFEAVIPGPQLYYMSTALPASGQMNDYMVDGYASPPIQANNDILLFTVVIHCTGLVSDTTVMFDDLAAAGGAWVKDSGGVNDYPGLVFGPTGSTVIIHQIPEPASLALLALGGLALIRRR